MNETYLDMMEESLDRKITVLEVIQKENLIQKKVLENLDDFDENLFRQTIERKAGQVRELEKLNTGFTSLYEQIKTDLDENKAMYKDRIKGMQDRIRTITDLASEVEAQEKRNKSLADNYFETAHGRIGAWHRTNQAAQTYFQNMTGSGFVPEAGRYDRKK